MTSDTDHPLAPLGWDERVVRLVAAFAEPGRVIRVEYGACHVGTAEATVLADWTGPTSKQAGITRSPVVGDWVDVARGGGEHADVTAIADRWSALRRRDPAEGDLEQVLAANVDRVFVVASVEDGINDRRLDRMLAMAWDSGAQPVLVLTKPDLCADVGAAEAAAAVVAGEVDVLVVNGLTEVGLSALVERVRGATSVFLGPSGVGKSTIVNSLVGEERQDTGEVRAVDGRGRHTTTARDLVVVPGGGVVIDTPGIRSVGLWDAAGGIARQFPLIAELAEQCRFGDCAHGAEPGCAVRSAIDDGRLAADRFESHRQLQDELGEWERRVEEQRRSRGERRRR